MNGIDIQEFRNRISTTMHRIEKIGPDKSLQKLPHFSRAKVVGGEEYVRTNVFIFWNYLELIANKTYPKVPTNHLILNVLSHDPGMREQLDKFSKYDPHASNFGNLDTHLFLYKFNRYDGRVFQATDTLCQLLIGTDTPEDVPVSFFRAPYDIMYIEFGQERNLDYQLYHAESGKHCIEGAYVFTHEFDFYEGDAEEAQLLGLNPDKPTRKLEIMFVGTPLGKENIMDDVTRSIVFHIQDENMPLSDMLRQHFSYFSEQTQKGPQLYSAMKNMSALEQTEFQKGAELLAKFFLYLNTTNAITTKDNSLTDLKERIARLKQKKRAKLERKASKIYDKVIVGPTKAPVGYIATVNEEGGKAAHWRRGHYHKYRVGPGRKETKLKWLAPTLVNADKIKDGEKVKQKSYTIK